jgi:hemerythrin-like domain-containing protein
MSKFDELFSKIMCECKTVIKEEVNEEEFSNKVKELFVKVLAEEACDLAELIFKDDAEKQSYIDNAVSEYLDSIEEHILGDVEDESAFMTLADDVKLEKVKAAVADNSEAIFGKDIFA